MEKWEYTSLRLDWHNRRDDWFAKIDGAETFGMQDCLNKLGVHGWELVNTVLSPSFLTAVFKRKIGN